MRLEMKIRKAIIKKTSERYKRAKKKEKGKILDEFVELTGYKRNYASYVLRNYSKRVFYYVNGKVFEFVVGESKKIIRRRQKIYDDKVKEGLKIIWELSDYICSKRLVSIIPVFIDKFEKNGYGVFSKDVKEKLKRMSASTIDRMLREERKRIRIKGRARTKPGSLLKRQIPIRTFSEWDDRRPGFVEIDLVSHDGGDSKGDYAQTLDATDIRTGWTETIAVKNKAGRWVFEAIDTMKKDRFPFKILGIDSDNDAAFINEHFLRYCKERKITFTRSRPYKKNDNCYVEQKNYSIIRRYVGYYRYDTEEEVKLLNKLYLVLRLYTNYFQPVMKCIEKTRIGSKVKKVYDKPRTPYKRVLECEEIEEEKKEELMKIFDSLDPVMLKRNIEKIQNELLKAQMRKRRYINVLCDGKCEKA